MIWLRSMYRCSQLLSPSATASTCCAHASTISGYLRRRNANRPATPMTMGCQVQAQRRGEVGRKQWQRRRLRHRVVAAAAGWERRQVQAQYSASENTSVVCCTVQDRAGRARGCRTGER